MITFVSGIMRSAASQKCLPACHNALVYLANFACAVILTLPGIGSAETRTEELKRCLQDFDGIEWKLPYRPPIHIRACSSPRAVYDTSEKPGEGRRSLELIGELTLGPDNNLSSDETYAALQSATFAHFNALFLRRGFRSVALEQGDARTKYYRHLGSAKRGEIFLERTDDPSVKAPSLPPIPYVSQARYVRTVSGREVTLTYKTAMKNTWLITIDGLPDTAGGAR